MEAQHSNPPPFQKKPTTFFQRIRDLLPETSVLYSYQCICHSTLLNQFAPPLLDVFGKMITIFGYYLTS